MDANGTWKVAPAREDKNPTKKHLMELGDYYKLKNSGKIIDEVQTVVLNWKTYANQCKVTTESKNRIEKIIGRKS